MSAVQPPSRAPRVRLVGRWRSVCRGDGRLAVLSGPGPCDDDALGLWLRRGCTADPPVRQGFLVASVDDAGALDLAGSSRTEVAAHYAFEDDNLVVAPDPGTLIRALRVKPALNLAKLAGLGVHHDDATSTVYEGVFRLPIGHALAWRPGRPRVDVRRWFAPDPAVRITVSDREAAVLMRTAVTEAVESSLPSTGCVAATLSGGLDSAMVVASAAPLLAARRQPLDAYTHVPAGGGGVNLPGWEADDGPYAQRLAAELGLASWSALANTSLRAPIEVVGSDRARRVGMPVPNSANLGWVLEAVVAAERGRASVLLGGDSGNITFSRDSAGLLADLAAERRWSALLAATRSEHRRGRSWAGAVRHVVSASAPHTARRVRRLRGRPVPAPAWRDWTNPIRKEALDAALQGADDGPDPLPTRSTWLADLLGDRSSSSCLNAMSDDVWCSDPLSDPQVVRLAVQLPTRTWIPDGVSRGLARSAATGLVPDHVRLRHTRGGQAFDVAAALAGKEREHRELVDRLRDSASACAILDLDQVARSIEGGMPTGNDAYGWATTVGGALCLGLFAADYESD